MNTAGTFRDRSRLAVQDANLQRALKNATSRFLMGRAAAVADLPGWETMREEASRIKEETLARLDEHLEDFTRNATQAGAQVHRVRDAEAALEHIASIVRRTGAKLAVKGKSMVSEEIELNDFLARLGVRALETDLGEYIVQLAREMPSHILAPAIHKTRRDVQQLFQALLGEGKDAEIEELTLIARRRLRAMFLEAGIGFSGANFLVAETGSIVLVENEGNIRFSTSLPRVHVAIAGIEKVIPRERDLEIFLPLLIRSGTGQKMSSYVSVITGPRRAGDRDGPEEVHVLLLDNGRRKILDDPRMRPVLKCIRCAACLNTCPVYQSTGGHTYASVYSGPIGSVLTPQLRGLKQAGDLPFASSLCGACGDICPVKVPLPHLLLDLRANVVRNGSTAIATAVKKKAFRFWAAVMSNPRAYSIAGKATRAAMKWSRLAGMGEATPAFEAWMRLLGAVEPPKRSFHDLWSEIAKNSPSANRRVPLRAQQTSGSEPSPSSVATASGTSAGRNEGGTQSAEQDVLVRRFINEIERVGGQAHRVASQAELLGLLDQILRAGAPQTVLVSGSAARFAEGLEERIAQLGCASLNETEWSGETAKAAEAATGISGAFAALADSGSLLLRHGAGEPRSFSLLPEHHVAVLSANQIVASLSQAISKIAGDCSSFNSSACWTFITGPSRTGDIELTLTIGVHGPKKLTAIIVEG